MSIPNIPEGIHHTTLKKTIIDLLESIALEETALSSILNSEATKIDAFVGKQMDFPTKPSTKEIITFNQTISKMMDSLLMTEWLLFRKLDTVMQLDLDVEHDGEQPYEDKDSLWEDEPKSGEKNRNNPTTGSGKDKKEEITYTYKTNDEDFYW